MYQGTEVHGQEPCKGTEDLTSTGVKRCLASLCVVTTLVILGQYMPLKPSEGAGQRRWWGGGGEGGGRGQ